MTNALTEGDIAPDFTLMSDKYEEFTLSNFENRNIVVLYFYPKDNTPGCTQEAKEFTEFLDEFKACDAVIVGMSKDDTESHEHFKTMHKLGVTLVSDHNLEVMPKYGVWVEKNMYGKKYMGVERSTFIIDKEGKIRRIWRKVKVKGHALEVLEEVKKMG